MIEASMFAVGFWIGFALFFLFDRWRRRKYQELVNELTQLTEELVEILEAINKKDKL